MADPFQAFETGRQAAEGGNPIANAIRSTIQRIKQYDELKQQTEVKGGLMRLESQLGIEAEKEKQKAALSGIKDILGQGEGQGNLPPGTSFSAGGLNIPLSRKYTESEVKNLTTAEALSDEIGKLRNIIQGESERSFTQKAQVRGALPWAMGSEIGQEYQLLRKSIGERLLRLRSGAQINAAEYKRFMEMLPSIFRKDKIDLDQLDRFETEFQNIKSRIETGQPMTSTTNQMKGEGQIMIDANGNKAMVYPDGSYEEVK